MPPANDSIRLLDTHSPGQIAQSDVYFTFASGRLNYDCVSCNAQCCRGHGYLLRLGTELDHQLQRSPYLKLFLEPPTHGNTAQYQVRNCPPACFFLNPQGLCDIHARHGYAAKPETCRLFPFNQFRRLATYLIVMPHQGLCPLQIVPPGETSDKSQYTALLQAMSTHGITAAVRECATIDDNVPAVISAEREIVCLSEAFLDGPDYTAFAVAQLLVTAQDPTVPSEIAMSGDNSSAVAGIDRSCRLICEILGSSATEVMQRDSDLTRTMAAITPVLRSHLVFRDPQPVQSPATQMVRLDQIPYVLLATYVVARCARLAGMHDITYQTILRLFHDFRPLIQVLACADTAMVWQPTVPIELPAFNTHTLQASYLRIARALLPSIQDKQPVRLGVVLCEHLPSAGVERLLFLKQVARTLARQLIPRDSPRLPQRNVRLIPIVRSATQRWALANVSQDVLESAYARLSRAFSGSPPPHGSVDPA